MKRIKAFLTAYGEFEYAREALRFGAVSFVLKPLVGTELEEELIKAKNSMTGQA